MILDLNSTKKLFNYILNNDYEIILDKNHNDIMYIKHNNSEMKCKYVLIFSTINEENNKIIWSYDNQYIDRKTREISKILKKEINEENTVSNASLTLGLPSDYRPSLQSSRNRENLNEKSLIKIINKIISRDIIIKFEEEEIIPLWIIRNKNKIGIQYYMIIDIIYL
jgi:pantothenate synthetase